MLGQRCDPLSAFFSLLPFAPQSVSLCTSGRLPAGCDRLAVIRDKIARLLEELSYLDRESRYKSC